MREASLYELKIDYGRILCAIISFYYMKNSPFISIIFYIISVLLDMIDGECARRLNQCLIITKINKNGRFKNGKCIGHGYW